MRIGIDGACLSNRRGFGRFARGIVSALARVETDHQFVILIDQGSRSSVHLDEHFETIEVETREIPTLAASSTGRRRIGDMLAFSRAAAKGRLDLIYFPASYTYFPVWGVQRVVVTLHDTLALTHPEWVFPTWQGKIAWQLKEAVAVYQAQRIVTVSEASKRDLIAWYKLRSDRILVIAEGPDEVFQPTAVDDPRSADALRRHGIDPGRPFLIYVGGLSPHKNLPRLIEAFSRVGHLDVRLIVVGDFNDVFHTHYPELRTLVARLNLGHRIHFTGFVPDSDLVYLYGRALALVQPSLMEGFGLPPIESMACGTPVLASNAGSLPEVVGPAGQFFNPTDITEMASVLNRFLDDPNGRAEALERAKFWTWDRAASGLLSLFEEV